MEEEKAYRYWMHNLPEIGDRTIEKLLKEFGSAKDVYRARNNLPKQMLRKNAAEGIKEFSKTWEIERQYVKLQES